MFPVLAMNAWNDVGVVDSNFNLGTLMPRGSPGCRGREPRFIRVGVN